MWEHCCSKEYYNSDNIGSLGSVIVEAVCMLLTPFVSSIVSWELCYDIMMVRRSCQWNWVSSCSHKTALKVFVEIVTQFWMSYKPCALSMGELSASL